MSPEIVGAAASGDVWYSRLFYWAETVVTPELQQRKANGRIFMHLPRKPARAARRLIVGDGIKE